MKCDRAFGTCKNPAKYKMTDTIVLNMFSPDGQKAYLNVCQFHKTINKLRTAKFELIK